MHDFEHCSFICTSSCETNGPTLMLTRETVVITVFVVCNPTSHLPRVPVSCHVWNNGKSRHQPCLRIWCKLMERKLLLVHLEATFLCQF